MPALADTNAGPLTAADLIAARQHSTGTLYLHRIHCEPGAIVSDDDCERIQAAEACTELGADTRPALLSMERHTRTAGRVVLALLMVPAVAAVAAVLSFAASH